MRDSKYRLQVDAGFYDADSLRGLLFLIMAHRLEHWLKGGGWVD